MARVNVYLPDELAEEVRAADLNVSGIVQEALRAELSARRSTAWVRRVTARRGRAVSHDRVLVALDEVRREAGDDWPEAGHR